VGEANETEMEGRKKKPEEWCQQLETWARKVGEFKKG